MPRSGTWLGLLALALVLERRLSNLALTSNCFLLPLNLNSEVDLCIFDWPSIIFACASSLVLRYPLNKENTSSTSSELWGLGFAEGSLGFDASTTDSKSDSSAIKLTVNTSESGMRERERTHSTWTNLWCRLTNQKVPENPVENWNIPAENTFSQFLEGKEITTGHYRKRGSFYWLLCNHTLLIDESWAIQPKCFGTNDLLCFQSIISFNLAANETYVVFSPKRG